MTSTAAEATTPDEARPDHRRGRLHRADLLVAVGAVLFGVLTLVPWYRTEAFDLGFGHRAAAASANGLDSGLVVTALVLLVLAGGWSLLPAVTEVAVPFPRWLPTAVLAVGAFLLTLLEWLSSLDLGVSLPALLALLTVAAVVVVGVRQLVPQARDWVAAERAVDRT